MKVTTKTGDMGQSGLFSGERLDKDDCIFEVLGSIDELVSYLGLIKAIMRDEEDFSQKLLLPIDSWLEEIQQNLFHINSEIATNPESELYSQLTKIKEPTIEQLEQHGKELMDQIQLPNQFIIPGSMPLAAHIDVVRTIARRCERSLIRCANQKSLSHLQSPKVYLNRLSDYLFMLARYIEQH